MRLSAILLLAATIHVSARGWSQTVTLSVKNVPVQKVFREIFRQTGISVIYKESLFEGADPISLNVKDASIAAVLKACFRGLPITYHIGSHTILVLPQPSVPDPGGAPANLTDIQGQGEVVGPDGRGIAGVTVLNKRTKKNTATDKDGFFTIRAQAGDLLEFSSVGYRSRQYKVTDGSFGSSAPEGVYKNLVITMEVEVAGLSETVVIGYGSAQKKDLTGSVSTVSSKDVENTPFTTIDNALAGKAAGVQVTKTDGSPGGAVRIRVRGSTSILGGNDPLYVIDGVPVQVQSSYINPGFDLTSPAGNGITGAGGLGASLTTSFTNGLNSLGGLNIDDIESITILKDASSTAIYGSKAANGVVIINTKKGKKDMKPQITVSYYGTGTSPINPKLLNLSQYKSLLTEAAQNDYNYRSSAGQSIPANVTAILNDPNDFFGKGNTNWLDVVTRSTYANNVQVSVQGGGSASKYYTSVSYLNTPGVVRGSSYQRVAGKLNLENEIGSHFRFITNMDLAFTNQNITNGAYGQALKARPDYTPYDSTGNFTNFAAVGAAYQGFQNPLAFTTAINNSKNFSLLGSLTALYDITPVLQFKSTVSLNMQNYSQRNFTPSYLDIGNFYGNVSVNGGIGSNSNSNFTDWFIENTLAYNKKFNENHSLNFLAGTSYETTRNSFFSATASGYPNDNVLNSLSSAVTPLYVKGDDPSKPQAYLLSFYLRANYTFMDKYLFTFTGRTDGSSKFGPDNKFGYFPSGAIAWRMSKENFMKNINWIDDLKFRGSYGLTGTQNIGNQLYRTLYTPYSYNGNNALVPTQLGNPAIKWETTKATDAGLDFSLFKGRLQGTFDYYKKLTDGALLSLPVAPSTSYSSLLQNIVSLKNWGYEFNLQGDIIRTNHFKWSASVNITWNKSLVTKINKQADLTQIPSASGLEYGNFSIEEGKPLGIIAGMKVTGIIKTRKQLDDYKGKLGIFAGYFGYLGIGDPMFLLDTVTYKAYNSEYPLFNTDLADAAPKYFGGFTQGFSYKNFDLNFYFTFSQGGKLMWADHVNSLEFVGTANLNANALNRWTPQNPNSNQPRLLLNDDIIYNTNLSIFNSSYIKLRTLTLNYRFDQSGWMKRSSMRNASVFVSAMNVFTITKYPGNDPEASDDPYSVAGGYFDVSNYPPVRSFSMGLKIGF